jgi:nicotinate-nucleotide adenylyltransferase
MRLALYGGSFDPIHHGHLILARDAREQLHLDRVIFLPAAVSPHKPHLQPAPPELRGEMVRAAIADEPGFEVDDWELGRVGPSYSIDTAEHMRARFPDAELFYLIGHDNIAQLATWRRFETLSRIVQFVVFGRGGSAPPHPYPRLERRLDISATEIRERVARKASIRYLVPDAVRNLIERHQLYQEHSH